MLKLPASKDYKYPIPEKLLAEYIEDDKCPHCGSIGELEYITFEVVNEDEVPYNQVVRCNVCEETCLQVSVIKEVRLEHEYMPPLESVKDEAMKDMFEMLNMLEEFARGNDVHKLTFEEVMGYLRRMDFDQMMDRVAAVYWRIGKDIYDQGEDPMCVRELWQYHAKAKHEYLRGFD